MLQGSERQLQENSNFQVLQSSKDEISIFARFISASLRL
jgi:hypothetical protein